MTGPRGSAPPNIGLPTDTRHLLAHRRHTADQELASQQPTHRWIHSFGSYPPVSCASTHALTLLRRQSGLESYSQHGFLPGDSATSRSAGILSFIQKSLHIYANLNLPFVTATHSALSPLCSRASSTPVPSSVFDEIQAIDNLFEAMVLNHVARRASTAQGVALLTLYERAFASEGEDPEDHGRRALIERMRLAVRTGGMHGHLPVGFAVLTAALGLPLGEPVVNAVVLRRRGAHLLDWIHSWYSTSLPLPPRSITSVFSGPDEPRGAVRVASAPTARCSTPGGGRSGQLQRDHACDSRGRGRGRGGTGEHLATGGDLECTA